tara:strand:+ start:548 stop:856 length:309 start_codon:yes stop_codon:yes gene_type:complete
MAKFITIETADAARGILTVNTEQIFVATPGDETTTGGDIATEATIFQNGLTSYINLKTNGGAANTGTILAARINSAITANPGGQVAAVRLPSTMTIDDVIII